MIGKILKHIIIIIGVYSFIATSSTISALRYGSDSTDNDVKVQYRAQNSKFYLTFDTNFAYIKSEFIMCFRDRPIGLSSTDISSCYLKNSQNSFSCLDYKVSGSAISYAYFQLSSDKKTITNTLSYTPSDVISGSNYGSYSISLTGTLANKTSYNYISNTKSIYQVLSNANTSFDGSKTSKTNYLTSYAADQNLTVSNLLMPRNFQCFIYNGYYATGLFYGGVYRSTTPIMMIALVTINLNSTIFGAWQGISFSSDHAYRDMIGVVLNSGSITDLFSFYASAPYDDTSTNVGGTTDVYLISSTGLTNHQAFSSVYITQLYRNYDTGDSAGDEVIMYKVENQFCLASYFTSTTSSVPRPTSSKAQHMTYNCWTPDLTLYSKLQQFYLGLLFLILMSLNL